MQPQIDIEILASPFCFLDRAQEFNVRLKVELHYRQPITLVTTGSIFDPAATFLQNRLQIIDIATGDVVLFPNTQSSTSEENVIATEQPALVLRPGSRIYDFWTTDPPSGRWREYPFDPSGLAPNRQYIITYRDHGITAYFSGSEPTQSAISSDHPLQVPPLTVNLLTRTAPIFSTRPTLPPPPPITASLTASTPFCALSGTPPFTICLEWTSHSDRAIYALQTRVTGHNIGLEIRDPARKGRRIGPPSDRLCGDGDGEDGLPDDDERLVRLEKRGDFFREEYTLGVEPKRGGLISADLKNLVGGKGYALSLRKEKWRWVYGDEVAVGKGKGAEGGLLRGLLEREPWVEWKPQVWFEFRAE